MYAHDFQCKHSHNYDDVLFHIFVDCMMPAPRGAEPEHNMCQALILFMKENIDKVERIAQPFLSKKKLTLDAYIAFIEQPGHWGDELALHLLAVMSQIHYCIITNTQVFYSHPSFSSPSDIHMKLVYLGNSIFRDTTKLRSAHHHFTLILTSPSPKILHLERLTTKTGSRNDSNSSPSLSLSMPRNWSWNQKKKKNIHPLPIPQKIRESSRLLKARSTKFGDQKKTCSEEMFLVFRGLYISKRAQ